MSFKRKPVVIEFPEDHDLHGLVAYAKRPRTEQIEAVQNVGGETEQEVENNSQAAVAMFGDSLISWNYVDESDAVVPATKAGFASIDIEAQMHILQQWVKVAIAVSPDLGKGSDSGPSSRERLTNGMPTVTDAGLSVALQSLPMHSEP